MITILVLGTNLTTGAPKQQSAENKQLYPVIQKGRWGFIDGSGRLAIAAQYDAVDPHLLGRDPARLWAVKLNGKWGYIDKRGRTVIKFRFDEAVRFKDRFARVRIDDKWGYIDGHGKIVIRAKYLEAYDFCSELALVTNEDGAKRGVITRRGKALFWRSQMDWGEDVVGFSEGLLGVLREDADGTEKAGYIKRDGEFAIPARYDEVKSFSEGLAPVMIDWKWGFIDKKGNTVVEPKFFQALTFHEGLAAVVDLEGKWGYIDKEGKMAVPQRYSEAGQFSEGLACVKDPGRKKCGYIDTRGKIVIDFIYDTGNEFVNGVTAVMVDGGLGYIRKDGSFLWSPSK